MKKWVIVLFQLVALRGVVQTLPEAPKLHRDKVEISLLIADASVRGLDVYSTHRALQGPNHEKLLPNCIATNTSTMTVYSVGVVVLDWYIARELDKKGHRRLAHISTLVDMGQDAPWAIHNLFLSANSPSSIITTSPSNPIPIPIPY